MTAATSPKNKSCFGIRYFNKIREGSKLMIVNFVLSLLGLPMLCIAESYGCYLEQINSNKALFYDTDGLEIVSGISLVTSMGLGLVIALFFFSYLYRKTITDMNYALPLNTKQRFFADYLSGLTVYMVPILSGGLIALAILGFCSTFINDVKEVWEDIDIILSTAAVIIIGLILFYTLCVLAITFAGSTFEAIFSCIALNVMIPAVIACFWGNVINSTAFGISYDNIIYNPLLTSTSPIGNAVYMIADRADLMYDYTEIGSGSIHTPFIKWVIFTLICLAAYILIAYVLYKIRKAEDVSKPYVFKWYYYLTVFAAVFCILSVFIFTDSDIIPGLIICGIGWFILEVITRRGFKRLWVGMICFAGAVALTFGISGLCKKTDGFGITKHVPSSVMVSDVDISITGTSLLPYQNMTFKDKKIIEDVVALHQEVIDRYSHPEKYDYPYEPFPADREKTFYMSDNSTISIKYSLRNGAVECRGYTVTSDMLGDLWKDIILSDEYADSMAKNLISAAKNNYGNYRYGSEYSAERLKDNNGIITLSDKMNLRSQEKVLSMEQVEEIAAVYKKDLLAMTEEDLRNSTVWGIFSNGSQNFILDSFTDTKAVLTRLGFRSPAVSEDLFNQGDNDDVSPTYIGVYPEVFNYAYDDNYYKKDPSSEHYLRNYYRYTDTSYTKEEKAHRKEIMTYVSANHNNYYGRLYSMNANNLDFNKDLTDLLNSATYLLFNEKPSGAIVVEGTVYFIPDRNNNKALVERVYEAQFKNSKLIDQ